MLDGLQAEIDSRPDLANGSKDYVISALNEDGSALTETYVTIPLEEQKIKISRLKLLTYLTGTQRAGLRAMLEGTSHEEKDMAMLFYADDEYWINDPFFLVMLDTLASALSIDPTIVAEIKRLGERKISRAEELFSRKITEGDFE